MSEDRARHVLARITDTPALARVVPLLQPEVLHAVITHCGLQDCGELLALATPHQLSAVFDLDLWKTEHAGGDERFDADRFREWLDALAGEGAAFAAARLAQMDRALVVNGLSPHVRVFDAAVFSPDGEPGGAEAVANAAREQGLHAEIGSFIVVARRGDSWEAIVDVLLALVEQHADTFHSIMRACCRLSHAGFELDGLDDLLPDLEQARFDLSAGRERRRDRLGFLPPEQARAFLDAARCVRLTGDAPPNDQVFLAYRRTCAAAADDEGPGMPGSVSATEAAEGTGANEASRDTAPAIASVIEVLRGAGMLADAPRALLPGAKDEHTPVHPALNRYLQLSADSGEAAWTDRNRELAFLANALVAGCSVQGRPFTRREAVDVAAATSNLGLEYWPQHWPAPESRDLVTVFQTGWATLHGEVSMATAAQLLRTLDRIRSLDRDLQLELHTLRRELVRQQRAKTPWRARGRLEVLAPLDLPAWAALAALLDECPVMLRNVSRRGGRNVLTVDPSEFEFISDVRDIAAVQAFLLSIPETFS